MKNMKSYVRASLGLEDLGNFNNFEKGVIYMERSRLSEKLPSRAEFETALNFAKDGLNGLVDYDGPSIVKQVGALSVDLLKIQLEILDKHPEINDWTYQKSMEVTLSHPDLCDKLDFTAGKLYKLMPLYSKEMEMAYIKEWMSR